MSSREAFENGPGWKCAEGVELGKPPMRGCELRDDAVGVFKP